jgi:CMP-N,N'-diacetyllegionaminic acid synthase
MSRVLGLINARGGSKGIPRKNIRHLNGKPLIAYAILSGLEATSVDRVVVSTDDREIAGVARDYGADTPFMRPPELASDKALQIDAVRHAIEQLAMDGDNYDVVVILQPTCPLRTAADIDGAISLMRASQADTVISVTEVTGQHPLTMYTMESDGHLSPLLASSRAGVLRQEFRPIWWRNGAIYAINKPVVMKDRSLYGGRVVGYPMPAERSVNIDEPLDWIIAEAMLQHLSKVQSK